MAGEYHSAAMVGHKKSSNRELYTWGAGDSGRTGLGHEYGRAAPVEMSHHRTRPRKKLLMAGGKRSDDEPSARREKWDWLGPENGHVLQWAAVACGGRHSLAITQSGQLFAWGADDHGQLGHGTRVTQRLPTLVHSLGRSHGTTKGRGAAREMPQLRELACGQRFSAALAWSGAVYVWGLLGGVTRPTPTMVKRLEATVVARIACGQEHLAMITGDRESLAEAHTAYEEGRIAGIAEEEAGVARQREELARQAAEAKAAAEAARQEVKDEKKRKRTLKKLVKKRERMERKAKTNAARAMEEEEKKKEEERKKAGED